MVSLGQEKGGGGMGPAADISPNWLQLPSGVSQQTLEPLRGDVSQGINGAREEGIPGITMGWPWPPRARMKPL